MHFQVDMESKLLQAKEQTGDAKKTPSTLIGSTEMLNIVFSSTRKSSHGTHFDYTSIVAFRFDFDVSRNFSTHYLIESILYELCHCTLSPIHTHTHTYIAIVHTIYHENCLVCIHIKTFFCLKVCGMFVMFFRLL